MKLKIVVSTICLYSLIFPMQLAFFYIARVAVGKNPCFGYSKTFMIMKYKYLEILFIRKGLDQEVL